MTMVSTNASLSGALGMLNIHDQPGMCVAFSFQNRRSSEPMPLTSGADPLIGTLRSASESPTARARAMRRVACAYCASESNPMKAEDRRLGPTGTSRARTEPSFRLRASRHSRSRSMGRISSARWNIAPQRPSPGTATGDALPTESATQSIRNSTYT